MHTGIGMDVILQSRLSGEALDYLACGLIAGEEHRMLHIIRLAVAIALIIWVFAQVRKPSGWLGRRVVRAMNVGHATLLTWALQQLSVPKSAAILDIGCGGGATVQKLAALAPEGRVVGIDYSAASVSISREVNAEEIAAGRVQIKHGSVTALPFPDCTFDIVTAVETHYYWPDLPANVREVQRVLKPGGTFALIAETYRGGPLRLLYGMVMPLIRAAFLSDQEHRDLLTEAGFTEVATQHLKGKNWILALGRRPLESRM